MILQHRNWPRCNLITSDELGQSDQLKLTFNFIAQFSGLDLINASQMKLINHRFDSKIDFPFQPFKLKKSWSLLKKYLIIKKLKKVNISRAYNLREQNFHRILSCVGWKTTRYRSQKHGMALDICGPNYEFITYAYLISIVYLIQQNSVWYFARL